LASADWAFSRTQESAERKVFLRRCITDWPVYRLIYIFIYIYTHSHFILLHVNIKAYN
jgi:hypothetical protein